MNVLSLLELINSSKSLIGGKIAVDGSIDQIRRLQSAKDELLTQAGLIRELAEVEWSQEKIRIARMVMIGALVFASLLCLMVAAGILVMVLVWDTPYRLPTAIGVFVVYGISTVLLYESFKRVAARSEDAFSATREEIAANITLVKSTLWP